VAKQRPARSEVTWLAEGYPWSQPEWADCYLKGGRKEE